MVELKQEARPRWRKTRAGYDRRAIVVALQPHALLIRLERERHWLELPYSHAYLRAHFLAADLRARQKREQRRKRG